MKKNDKYNPQIPRKYDGQAPANWFYPELPVRVKIYITPIRKELQMPAMLSRYMSNRMWAYHAFPYYEDDYETPYQNTLEALEQLMPGKYVVAKSPTTEYEAWKPVQKMLTLYCESWIDPVVIRLTADREKPTGLETVKIEYRNIPARRVAKISSMTQGMINSVCYNEHSSKEFPLHGKRINGFFI